jgi:1-acyl-sn-glycerol-3-phosphate acyltransferase
MTFWLLITSFLFGTGTVLYFGIGLLPAFSGIVMILFSWIVGLIFALFMAFGILSFSYVLFGRNDLLDQRKHMVAKGIVSALLKLFRIELKVTGYENLPKNNSFLLYANHTSELDIPILMNAIIDQPLAFLSKMELRSWPLIGLWAEAIGCVFINRTSLRQSAMAMKQVALNVEKGLNMAIFPEGTIKHNPRELLTFKPGAFKIALEHDFTLVPVAIIRDHLSIKGKNIVLINIHKPLSPKDDAFETTTTLADYVKRQLEGDLQ